MQPTPDSPAFDPECECCRGTGSYSAWDLSRDCEESLPCGCHRRSPDGRRLKAGLVDEKREHPAEKYAREYRERAVFGIDVLRARVAVLEDAIRTHRAQKADDRCILDDDRLYEVLGDGIRCDRRVGCQQAMLKNCERFIAQRTEPGGWPTYFELEAEISRLRGCVHHSE